MGKGADLVSTSSGHGPGPKASSNKDDEDGDASFETIGHCTPKVHVGQQKGQGQGWS